MDVTSLQTLDNDLVLIGASLLRLVIFAMLLERALYFIFDWSMWREWLPGKSIRGPATLAVAWLLCYWHDFDLVSVILNAADGITQVGVFVTACIVAGGSQSAMKLFQDVMGLTREGREALQKLNKKKLEADIAEQDARIANPNPGP